MQTDFEQLMIPANYVAQMKAETEAAIKRGWDASKRDWRVIAMSILCRVCLTKREFTVNDFRDEILNSGVSTHDNRAMGGLMTTAKKLGWITSISAIPSQVGHKTPIQVWRSQIYQEPSRRELQEVGMRPLF